MKSNLPNSFYCYIYGHNYHLIEKANNHTHQLICKNCKKHFEYAPSGEIIRTQQPKKREEVQLSVLRKI